MANPISTPNSHGPIAPQIATYEEILSSDTNIFGETQYQNATALGTYLIKGQLTGTDYAFTGLQLIWNSTLNCTLKAGFAVSTQGTYFSNGSWGFVANTGTEGNTFSCFMPADDATVTFSSGSATGARIDILEIAPNRLSDTTEARNFLDPITNQISAENTPTRYNFTTQWQIKTGTPGSGVAPAADAGWIKVAEVTVPQNATAIAQSDIVGVGQSASWTTSPSATAITSFLNWDTNRWYWPGEPVFAGGNIYFSLALNQGQNPSGSPTYWQIFNLATGSSFLNVTPQYIANPGFDSDTSGWNLYQNTAQTTPVSGTGGTVTNLSFARNTTSPMFGAGDAILSKAAFNDQGEGVSYDFTIDPGIVGQPLKVRFYYNTSANYVAGDVGVFMYDKTNSILIPLSVSAVPQSTGGPTQFLATFFPSTSTSYRLIFHIASTNALAWTFEMDNVEVSPYFAVTGDAISGWQQYPMTIGATTTAPTKGTITTDIAQWRRVGSDMEITYHLVQSTTGAAAGNGTYLFPLPVGYTIDTSKMNGSDLGNTNYEVGVASIVTSGNVFNGTPIINPITSLSSFMLLIDSTSVYENRLSSSFNAMTSITEIHFQIRVPIAQWTPNTNLATDFTEYASNSSSTDANDTTSFVYGSGGSVGIFGITSLSTPRTKRVQFQRAIQVTDKLELEIFSPVTNTWFPATGCSINGTSMGSWTWLQQNTTTYGITLLPVSGALNQIDVLFGQFSSSGVTSYGGSGSSWNNAIFSAYRWRVRKISNGNMAEQLPVVRAHYNGVNQANNNVVAVINYPTKVEDTHNAVTTGSSWKFTAPVSGVYLVTFVLGYSGSASVNGAAILYKNGVAFEDNLTNLLNQTVLPGGAFSYYGGSASTTIRLNIGDYIQLEAGTVSSQTFTHGFITISRIGP